jgi:hypothetical protein
MSMRPDGENLALAYKKVWEPRAGRERTGRALSVEVRMAPEHSGFDTTKE